MADSYPAGRPLPLSAHTEAVRARWAKVLGAADALSCEDTPVDFGKADPSAAFSSIDDLRERCDEEYLKPLRALVRAIRADATPIHALDDAAAASLGDLVDAAAASTTIALEPVWKGDGSVSLRRWRGADGIQALARALKDRCL